MSIINARSINLMVYLGAGKMHDNKALITAEK